MKPLPVECVDISSYVLDCATHTVTVPILMLMSISFVTTKADFLHMVRIDVTIQVTPALRQNVK